LGLLLRTCMAAYAATHEALSVGWHYQPADVIRCTLTHSCVCFTIDGSQPVDCAKRITTIFDSTCHMDTAELPGHEMICIYPSFSVCPAGHDKACINLPRVVRMRSLTCFDLFTSVPLSVLQHLPAQQLYREELPVCLCAYWQQRAVFIRGK